MRKVSIKLSAVSCALALLLVSGAPVFAEESGGGSSSTGESNTTTTTEHETPPPPEKETTKVETEHETQANPENNAKLTDTRLKICQNHEQVIDKLMGNASENGQKRLNLFSTIATRVENFYASKGKTLSNYDALVAAVNAKKAAAQSAVDALKAASTGFSCTGTNPSGSLSSFKAALKAEISALQDYRTAIRNLIVGVKSVTGTTNSGSTANQTSGGGSQ